MSEPNELLLKDIIKFCQIDLSDVDPEKGIEIINKLNSFLSKIEIELTKGYKVTLKQLKNCLRLFSPDLRGIDCIVFMHNLRSEKCIKAFKMQKPCDVIETFGELFLNISDLKKEGNIQEIIIGIKQKLWAQADKLEEEIAYLEKLGGIGGEMGMLVSGAIEELTMELDEIDERIMELDALEELFKSKLKITDKYIIVEKEGLKGLVFMDKYLLLIINIKKLEEIIMNQICEKNLTGMHNELKDLFGAQIE